MIDGASRSRGRLTQPTSLPAPFNANQMPLLTRCPSFGAQLEPKVILPMLAILLIQLPQTALPQRLAADERGSDCCSAPAERASGWPQRTGSSTSSGVSQPEGLLAPIDHLALELNQPPLPETKFAWADGETGGRRRARRMMPAQLHLGQNLNSAPVANQNQPRLVQWSREALQYYEGSTLVLSCSLAISSQLGRPLKFAWSRQAKPLQAGGRLSIESLSDYSFLRLADLRASDSGQYACVASNSLGLEDRTSTQVLVNVRLKWLAPPDGVERNSSGSIETVRVGQPASFGCSAAGQPRPRVRWFRLVPLQEPIAKLTQHQQLAHRKQLGGGRMEAAQVRTALLQLETPGHHLADSLQRLEIGGKEAANESRWRLEVDTNGQHELHSRLVLERAEAHHSGLYECEVTAEGLDQQQQQGDDRLRKLFGLAVNDWSAIITMVRLVREQEKVQAIQADASQTIRLSRF